MFSRALGLFKNSAETVPVIFDQSSLILDRLRKAELHFYFLQSAGLQNLKQPYLSIAYTLRLDMFYFRFANTIQQ